MTDDDMKGPWLLALGALTIGVSAVTAKLLKRRAGDADQRSDDETP